MKKGILYLLFLLGLSLVGPEVYSQANIGIEIYVDGRPVKTQTSELLRMKDITWSMRRVAVDCELKGEDCVASPWLEEYDTDVLMLSFDLDEFNYPCGHWVMGEDIEVKLQVTNPEHPLAGYSGTYVFKATSTTDFWGTDGMNLIRGEI